MRSPEPATRYISDSDSDGDVESDTDSDTSNESDTNSDTHQKPLDPQFVKCLIKIAQKHSNKPSDTVTFTKFIAALPALGRALKRPSKETLADLAKKVRRAVYLCAECDEAFIDKEDLKKHQQTCKTAETSPEIPRSPEKANKSPEEPKKAFPCDKCDKSYAYKANLKRHVQGKHTDSAGVGDEQNKSKRYDCKLCKVVRADIYKHYGTKHNIDNVEQMLFDDGTVLSWSDINTDNGNAPWFKKQLEKANSRYKDTSCRLCEIDPKLKSTADLQKHYAGFHKVEAERLSIIPRMFRAEIGAHLGETDPKSQRADKKVNVSDKKKVITNGKPPKKNDTQIIYKCKCGKATETYDASVEHSQEHLVAKHNGKEMGDTRNFAFEADIGHNNVLKVIKYDFETLLTDAWFDMFDDVAVDEGMILSSSIYMYKRCVKLHSEDTGSSTGIPAYRCEMCHFFVDPLKIDNHCKNYKTCAKNKPKGYYCDECDAHFYSAKVLENHKENHAAGFRLVTFNNKNDIQINKILGQLQNRLTEDSPEEEEIEENSKMNTDGRRIEIISDVVVSVVMQKCNLCNKDVNAQEIKAHYAKHQKEKEILLRNTRENNVSSTESVVNDVNATKEVSAEQPEANLVDNRMLTEDEDICMNDVTEENDGDGTVESWDSDSDSCPGPRHIVTEVKADINLSVNQSITEHADDAQSPEDALRGMFGANDSQASMCDDEELQSTQELQEILGDDTGNEIREGQKNVAEVSQDIFSEDITQGQNGVGGEANTINHEEPEANNEVEDPVHVENRVDSRMSSREIIQELIPDEDVGFDVEEFLKLNKLVSMNLSCRE